MYCSQNLPNLPGVRGNWSIGLGEHGYQDCFDAQHEHDLVVAGGEDKDEEGGHYFCCGHQSLNNRKVGKTLQQKLYDE